MPIWNIKWIGYPASFLTCSWCLRSRYWQNNNNLTEWAYIYTGEFGACVWQKTKSFSNVGSYGCIKGLEPHRLPCTCYSVFQFPCTPRSFTAEDSQKSASCLKHGFLVLNQFLNLSWDLKLLGYINTLLYVWKSCRCSKHWLYKGDVDQKLLYSEAGSAKQTQHGLTGKTYEGALSWMTSCGCETRGQEISLACMALTNLIVLNCNTQIYLFLYLRACQNFYKLSAHRLKGLTREGKPKTLPQTKPRKLTLPWGCLQRWREEGRPPVSHPCPT